MPSHSGRLMVRLFTPLFLKVDENPGGRAHHYLAALQITPASRSQYRLTITAAPHGNDLLASSATARHPVSPIDYI